MINYTFHRIQYSRPIGQTHALERYVCWLSFLFLFVWFSPVYEWINAGCQKKRYKAVIDVLYKKYSISKAFFPLYVSEFQIKHAMITRWVPNNKIHLYYSNPRKQCRDIARLDLSAWAESGSGDGSAPSSTHFTRRITTTGSPQRPRIPSWCRGRLLQLLPICKTG